MRRNSIIQTTLLFLCLLQLLCSTVGFSFPGETNAHLYPNAQKTQNQQQNGQPSPPTSSSLDSQLKPMNITFEIRYWKDAKNTNYKLYLEESIKELQRIVYLNKAAPRPNNDSKSCDFNIPQGSDLHLGVLILKKKSIHQQSALFANGVSCEDLSNDQPIGARINIYQDEFDKIQNEIEKKNTITHEILHVLGYNMKNTKFFQNHIYQKGKFLFLKSPEVWKYIKSSEKLTKCFPEGIPLDLQKREDNKKYVSHFHRYFGRSLELMSPTTRYDTINHLTKLTALVLMDSGVYPHIEIDHLPDSECPFNV